MTANSAIVLPLFSNGTELPVAQLAGLVKKRYRAASHYNFMKLRLFSGEPLDK